MWEIDQKLIIPGVILTDAMSLFEDTPGLINLKQPSITPEC
jgi:hypothetical protein